MQGSDSNNKLGTEETEDIVPVRHLGLLGPLEWEQRTVRRLLEGMSWKDGSWLPGSVKVEMKIVEGRGWWFSKESIWSH